MIDGESPPAYPVNPVGTVALPVAFERYQRHKWPGDHPYNEMRRVLVQHGRSTWVPKSVRNMLATPAERQAGGTLAGLEVKDRVRFLRLQVNWVRFEAQDRIERELKAVWRDEFAEFIGGFADGHLVAYGAQNNAVERERWEHARAYVEGIWGDIKILNFEYDRNHLFVPEGSLMEWLQRQPGGPTSKLRVSQKQALRFLRLLLSLSLVDEGTAEDLAKLWGFANLSGGGTFALPPALIPDFVSTGKRGKPTSREVMLAEFDRRRDAGLLSDSGVEEASDLSRYVASLAGKGYPSMGAKAIQNLICKGSTWTDAKRISGGKSRVRKSG